MRTLLLLGSCLAFLCGCSPTDKPVGDTVSGGTEASRSPAEIEPRRGRIGEMVTPETPKATWVPIFYAEIHRVASLAGEAPLREKELNESDIELRIWGGFGLTPLDGFAVSRTGNRWEAKAIAADMRTSVAPRIKVLAEPEQGWDAAWAKLLELQVLTLPDAASIECNPGLEDGFSYVVEMKKGDRYRTYMYENPDAKQLCPEADQLLTILRFIESEYGASWNGR